MLIRYLSKEKFEWLLSDKGIYIGAASSQTDENEGLYDGTLISKMLRSRVQDVSEVFFQKLDKLSNGLILAERDFCYLSSWYLGDTETREMWDEYGNDGVAIISDEAILIQELPEPLGNASSFYRVEYSNSRKKNSINEPLRFKEEKYCHESEFRIVVDMSQYSILTGFDKDRFSSVRIGEVSSHESAVITCCMSSKGMEQSHRIIAKKGDGYVIKYDLQRIIREIRLHPDSPEECVSKISERLKLHGINVSVRRSDLWLQS